MQVFIDTNILISAALFPGSVPDLAYQKAVTAPNGAVLSDQVVDELVRIFDRMFPQRREALEQFPEHLQRAVDIVATPLSADSSEGQIRDPNDRPVLRAALEANADVLLTGDKDFLESHVKPPRIMTATEFLGASSI